MANEHAQSVRLAEQAADDLERLFARIGGTEHPDGAVWRAYRTARRALSGGRVDQQVLADALATLRAAIQAAGQDILTEATELGQTLALAQLALYDEDVTPPDLPAISVFLAAVVAVVTAQATQARALFAATQDVSALIGDGERVGLLAPGAVQAELVRYTVVAHQDAYSRTLARVPDPTRYRRQAVATIGRRTTDCCLRVHGQVVDLDEPFTLTGTPRYASELMHPPFHRYCRTVEALVRAQDADDALTGRMADAADAERTARREETGTTSRFRSGTAINT